MTDELEEAKDAIGALVRKYGDGWDNKVWATLLAALAQPKEGEIPANLFDRPEDVDEAMRERRQAYPLPTAHRPSREEVRTALAFAFTNMKVDDLRWKATSHEGFDRALDHLTDALFKGET
jgi:hypothetical protein